MMLVAVLLMKTVVNAASTVVDGVTWYYETYSSGGKTKPENLQMLCADCNARKSNKFGSSCMTVGVRTLHNLI